MQWAALAAIAVLAANWLATGTIVVTIEDSPVQPVAIRLDGPLGGQWKVDESRRLVIAGMIPGEYRVVPVFAGTMLGPAQTVRVERSTVSTAHVHTAHYGGVRFEAEPGMCEPDDRLSFILAHVVVVRPDGSQRATSGNGPQPESPACHREIGGLPAGQYGIQITPPIDRMPPYDVSVAVIAGQWTTHRLRHPPVVVTGRVMFMGEPVSGAAIGFLPTTPAARAANFGSGFRSMNTAVDGRYAIALVEPGEYTPTVSAFNTRTQLPTTSARVYLSSGRNVHDIEAGGGRLRVRVIRPSAYTETAADLHIVIQQPPTLGRAVRANQLRDVVVVDLLPPGEHLVSVSASITTEQMQVVQFTASKIHAVRIESGAAVDLTVELIEHNGVLEIVNLDGVPMDGASVMPLPRSQSLRADDDGRVSLASIPPGTPVAIRSRTWDMTCHVTSRALHQRVTVATATVDVTLSYRDNASLTLIQNGNYGPFTGATISGVPLSTCHIPLDAFSVGVKRLPNGGDYTIMLPQGTYTLHLTDGRSLNFTAPGRLEIK